MIFSLLPCMPDFQKKKKKKKKMICDSKYAAHAFNHNQLKIYVII